MCNMTRKHTWLENTQNTTNTTSIYLLLQNKTTTTRHISIIMFISTAFMAFNLYRPVAISCVCLGLFKKMIQTDTKDRPSIVLSADMLSTQNEKDKLSQCPTEAWFKSVFGYVSTAHTR